MSKSENTKSITEPTEPQSAPRRGRKPLSDEEKARRKAERDALKPTGVPREVPEAPAQKTERKPRAKKAAAQKPATRGRKPKAAQPVESDPVAESVTIPSQWPGLVVWSLNKLYRGLGGLVRGYAAWQDAREVARAQRSLERQKARRALIAGMVAL